MNNVVVKIDPAAVAALTRSPQSPLFKTMFSAGEQLRVLAASQVHKVTGTLAASVRSEVSTPPDKIVVDVGTDVDYALYYHDGTRPHEIRPVKAKALRFVSGGQVIFAQKVNHPGTQPHPFLVNALEVIATRVLGAEVDRTRVE